MNAGNLGKFLLLDIVTGDEKSNSNPKRQTWYCIDLSKMRCEGDNWVVEKMDLKVSKIPQNSPYPSISVALGSVIYIICGHNNCEPNIIRMYYLDTSNPENEWLEGPSMNVVGDIGSAVVHEGRIYVFGGFVDYKERNPCSGKVYDPVLNNWEPLSDCPVKLDELQGKFVGNYDDRKILVHPCRREMLCAYDVLDKSWKALDHCFGFWDCHGVIMDDVLYVFEYVSEEIYGYDLIQLKWLNPINTEYLKSFRRAKYSKGMVLRDALFFKVEPNVLCLVYFDETSREGLDIYCKTFTIKKIIQEDGDVSLEAEVSSSTKYNLGEKGHCLNFLVM